MVPSPIWHPLPMITYGSMMTSGSITASAERNTVSGAMALHHSAWLRCAAGPAIRPLPWRGRRGHYPKDFSLFDKAVSDLVTSVGCHSNNVSQIIFLFCIIVGNACEKVECRGVRAAIMPPLQRRIVRCLLVASRSSTIPVMFPLSSRTTCVGGIRRLERSDGQ